MFMMGNEARGEKLVVEVAGEMGGRREKGGVRRLGFCLSSTYITIQQRLSARELAIATARLLEIIAGMSKWTLW